MTSDVTEKNKAIVLEFLNAMESGDVDKAADMFHEDGTFWVPGREGQVPFAGNNNRDQFIEIERKAVSHNDGSHTTQILGVIAEDDRVAVESNIRTTNSLGDTYNQDYHHLFVIKDGKIFVWKEYMDTQLTAEHFKALTQAE